MLAGVDECVLLVEDDPAISEITARGLGQAGFRVTKEQDGRQSLVRFRQEPFDLVVLDVMLPSLSGLEVCRRIRALSPVPILMLTAKAETADVVLGLEAGADDYVTKPFEMPELVARVRALLRRVGGGPEPEIVTAGDLEVDVAAHKASRAGSPIDLTATEFKLLVALTRHAGQVMTREMLLELVWDYDYLGDSRVVDMAIKRLREKVDRDGDGHRLIETVRGVGYRIDRDE
ncbi:MAG: response regulator transcription factor [Actinomycetota bacterium]|nr:response regulator transcription factor [Actinomycetota bacterium]